MGSFTPELVVAVDWSAASKPKPKNPSPDACWLAWAQREVSDRPAPEYFRTRAACEARVTELVGAHPGPALLGFDFPLGYPLASGGTAVLPRGRSLGVYLAQRVQDDETNKNNRFAVAAGLNQEIARRQGEKHGPFWGCPNSKSHEGLTTKKQVMRSLPEFRAVERLLRERRHSSIQSPWKLYTTGSVGSQTLLGLPMVHRLLETLAKQDADPLGRGRLWPFEPVDRDDAAVIAEIWPSLHNADSIDHPVKDARQVVAARDAMLENHGLVEHLPPAASSEGWILGVAA